MQNICRNSDASNLDLKPPSKFPKNLEHRAQMLYALKTEITVTFAVFSIT